MHATDHENGGVAPASSNDSELTVLNVRPDLRHKHTVGVQLVGRSDVQLVDTNRATKVGEPTDLVELARQVQQASDFVRARAHGRLEVIAEQMRFLQQQAHRVLSEAGRDDRLHSAACNMRKVPGQVYYLYERRKPAGQHYMSIVAPNEWTDGCPHEFLGAYKLEADMSWTPVDQVDKRQRDIAFLDQVLQRHGTAGSQPLPIANSITDLHLLDEPPPKNFKTLNQN